MQGYLAILIAAVAVLQYCATAPYAYKNDVLLRPSPINPDIPMDPKPAEIITFITDPKEIAKFKREISVEHSPHSIMAPTTISPANAHPLHQPEGTVEEGGKVQLPYHHYDHHREKRELKTMTSEATQPIQKSTLDNPTKPSTEPIKNKSPTVATSPAPPKRKRNRSTTTTSTTAPISSTTTATSLVKHRQKRNEKDETTATVPLIYRDQHKQPTSTLSHDIPEHHEQHALKPETSSEQEHTVQAQTLPFFFNSQQMSEQAKHSETKRDIPVPLVPKYHHPEESPKDDDKSSEEKNNDDTDGTTSTQHTTEQSTEKKTQKRTATEDPDAVQVEDLSENHGQHPKVYGHHQIHPIQQEQTISSTSGSSTTEHSVFRHRPVPVAELFAKGKTTEPTEKAKHEAN